MHIATHIYMHGYTWLRQAPVGTNMAALGVSWREFEDASKAFGITEPSRVWLLVGPMRNRLDSTNTLDSEVLIN